MANIDFSTNAGGEPDIEPTGLECPVNSTVTFRNTSSTQALRVSFDGGSPFSDFDLAPTTSHEMNVGSTPGTYGYAVNAVTPGEREAILKSKTADIHVLE